MLCLFSKLYLTSKQFLLKLTFMSEVLFISKCDYGRTKYDRLVWPVYNSRPWCGESQKNSKLQLFPMSIAASAYIKLSGKGPLFITLCNNLKILFLFLEIDKYAVVQIFFPSWSINF